MLRVFDRAEAELFVESVCVVRDQHPAAHFLEVGMLHDSLDQPFPKTVGTVVFVDEYIAQISED